MYVDVILHVDIIFQSKEEEVFPKNITKSRLKKNFIFIYYILKGYTENYVTGRISRFRSYKVFLKFLKYS